jgi:hypothetical protein
MAEPARQRDNLLVQVHHLPGGRLPAVTLAPAAEQDRAAGRAAFAYLGDLQLRLVFRLPDEDAVAPATLQDLARLELTPGKALALAAANARKLCGPPVAVPLAGGVRSLRGQDLDCLHACLLDRTYWRGQLANAPQGLLVALPRKGVLLVAPLGEPQAQAQLVRQARTMVAAAGPGRTSDCLYRFDDKGWHLHAELPRPRPDAARAAAAAAVAPTTMVAVETDAEREEAALEGTAVAHRLLLHTLLAGVLLHALLKAPLPPFLLLLLTLGVTGYGLRAVLRAATALGQPTTPTIGMMVANFVPLVNLGTWGWLLLRATRRLRDAGRAVRWPGVRA